MEKKNNSKSKHFLKVGGHTLYEIEPTELGRKVIEHYKKWGDGYSLKPGETLNKGYFRRVKDK